jgi:hypothetical protein
MAGSWSAYWYNGRIYTNDGGRGVDVMKLSGREASGARKLSHSNPQTQDAVLTRDDDEGDSDSDSDSD